MAPRPTETNDIEPEDPVVFAFTAALMKKLGYVKARDIARALGIDNADGERKVSRWVNGEGGPRFHNTMQLLTLAGWLTPEALRAYHSARDVTDKGAAYAIEKARQSNAERLKRLGAPPRSGEGR